MSGPRGYLMRRRIRRTLAFVNGIRAERGMEPLTAMPKGEPKEMYACPVARAVGGSALPTRGIRINGRRYRVPGYVADFMVAFDDGRIPELIA